MASLKAYLPSAGGTVWRNDRRLTGSTSSLCEGDSLSRTRIKHIVIREVWKNNVPSPHAVYKIDVMTQSNHWFILRRYREFYSLHQNLVKHYGIPSDMLPSKKLPSSMSLSHLESRRNTLEHYLQRLINSHHDVAESKELFQFLNVETHDVLCVTRQLATVLEKEGRNILASGNMFTFSPTQMYCITRQLQLPHFAGEQTEDEENTDLGYLYGFIQGLKSLCVSGLARRSSPCRELVCNQAFDLSLFKSLEKLQIEKCHISVIDGVFRIQKQLTHVTLKNSVKTMKEFLVDSAMQKRAVNQANCSVESWRNTSTTKLTENRVVVRPWLLLTHVNMSHNKIANFDHSLKLLPALEQLDLSYNEFVHLDLKQLTSSTLTFLDISHNNIHYISATAKDLRNLKSLLLSHNKLQNLDGLDCLRGLIELDVRNNDLKKIEELVKISSLLHMRILALTGNPCASSKTHRFEVFSQLKSRELILDGIKITESEKIKVQQQEQKTKVEKVVENPEHSPYTTSQHNTVDLKEKISVIDRDDDQDSGFGGNYAGSVDDGNLMFDWDFFGNCVQLPIGLKKQFGIHVAGPSSLAHARNEPTMQVKQGNVRVNVRERDVNQSYIGAAPCLKDGRIDKGKAPLKIKRLGQRDETLLKLRIHEECLPEKPELDGDLVGSVVVLKGHLGDIESERSTNEEGCETVINHTGELAASKENYCENNSKLDGELPVTDKNCTSICERLPSVGVGRQSENVPSDSGTASSVDDNSLISGVYSEKTFVMTEGPSLSEICDPSTVCTEKKKSLDEETFDLTKTKSCSAIGQSFSDVCHDYQFSQTVQQLSPSNGIEDTQKSSFLTESYADSYSVAEESSHSTSDISKTSSFPSTVASEALESVCHDET